MRLGVGWYIWTPGDVPRQNRRCSTVVEHFVEHCVTKMLHFETFFRKGFIFFFIYRYIPQQKPKQKIYISKLLIFNTLEKSLKFFAKKCKKSLEIKNKWLPLQCSSLISLENARCNNGNTFYVLISSVYLTKSVVCSESGVKSTHNNPTIDGLLKAIEHHSVLRMNARKQVKHKCRSSVKTL